MCQSETTKSSHFTIQLGSLGAAGIPAVRVVYVNSMKDQRKRATTSHLDTNCGYLIPLSDVNAG